MNFTHDVLIIGGGAQGLLILEQLVAQGYSCLLGNNRALGEGQTLDNHGWLHHGYVFPQVELASSLYQLGQEKWKPFLAAHPKVVRAHAKAYVAAPTLQFESSYLPIWNKIGMPHQTYTPNNLPAWMQGGSLHSKNIQVAKIEDQIINKSALVHALSAHMEDYILLGTVKRLITNADGQVVSVEIVESGAPDHLILQPKYVVICAGVGTLALLQQIEKQNSQDTKLEKTFQFGRRRAIHMICVQGKDDILPDLSIFEATPSGYHLVASHHDPELGTVLWYVTPMGPDAATYLSTHDPLQNNDDEAPVQIQFVQQAIERLMAKYPPLATVSNQLEWGVYASHKLDNIGPSPLSPRVELITPNVCVCNPGLLSHHFTVADSVIHHVKDFVGQPNGTRAFRPTGLKNPGVGLPCHNRATMNWLSWEQFRRTYKL